uniref:Uncharacterized protein n=1 Tax=Physcomitrium patens TaxID=3218 RepID=A0A2K1IZ76_PHYPA|nr:hypothetical protein PHYPA_024397 [Physcomitrium patens]
MGQLWPCKWLEGPSNGAEWKLLTSGILRSKEVANVTYQGNQRIHLSSKQLSSGVK